MKAYEAKKIADALTEPPQYATLMTQIQTAAQAGLYELTVSLVVDRVLRQLCIDGYGVQTISNGTQTLINWR